MTPGTLLTEFANRGIVIALAGDDIKLSASKGLVTPKDVGILRESKPEIIRRLRLAEGLPIDDEAAALLAMEEIDPADMPVCQSCGDLCDVQTFDDRWHCSPCDPNADERRRRTQQLRRIAEAYANRRRGNPS